MKTKHWLARTFRFG